MKTYHEVKSSLIKEIAYDKDVRELYVYFHKQDWQRDTVYTYFPEELLWIFLESESIGKFYLENIKTFFTTKNQTNMAKKQYDMFLDIRIDVNKINKDWLYHGEKGTYMDISVAYHEEPDPEYKTNGFVAQKVPKQVYENSKDVKGPILGNVKNWKSINQTNVDKQSIPGNDAGALHADVPTQDFADDLPF